MYKIDTGELKVTVQLSVLALESNPAKMHRLLVRQRDSLSVFSLNKNQTLSSVAVQSVLGSAWLGDAEFVAASADGKLRVFTCGQQHASTVVQLTDLAVTAV